MKGKWNGKYWFIGNVPETLENRITLFELTIDTFENSRITGSIFDTIETGGTAGTGTISGKIKGNKIKFIKRMPIKTSVLPDGTKIEEQKPHNAIYYQGIINENNTIEGTWKFRKGIGIIKGKLVIYPGTKGKWEMKKT